jgi:hypothetical protein
MYLPSGDQTGWTFAPPPKVNFVLVSVARSVIQISAKFPVCSSVRLVTTFEPSGESFTWL